MNMKIVKEGVSIKAKDKLAVEYLNNILDISDNEEMHIKADEAVANLLHDCGYVEFAKVYTDACIDVFWYA